ncbi:unnamed protein product [Strongylus vulgaris]|uniref:Uncharacterized protein n=1 Tax=Strongylus vulgaris TaxID=40348 RepID=A0A3P7HZ95_STRVU|nr:unnamed protein product [Strongylus vulgaris]
MNWYNVAGQGGDVEKCSDLQKLARGDLELLLGKKAGCQVRNSMFFQGNALYLYENLGRSLRSNSS